MRHRNLFRRAVLLVLFIIIGASFLGTRTPARPAPAAAQGTGDPATCVLTPEMLGGQGFSVTGLGFSVTGLGFSVTGLGFSVTGLGFSVTGLGLDPEQVAADIKNNPISNQWLLDRQLAVTGSPANPNFNTVKTALLIVDDFSNPFTHGSQVQAVFNHLALAVNMDNIDFFPINIGDPAVGYRADEVAAILHDTIEGGPKAAHGTDGLIAQGYEHFVANFSFGLLPCEAPATQINGTPIPAFDFDTAQEEIAEENEPVEPQKVSTVLECVVATPNTSRITLLREGWPRTQYTSIAPLGGNNTLAVGNNGSGGTTSDMRYTVPKYDTNVLDLSAIRNGAAGVVNHDSGEGMGVQGGAHNKTVDYGEVLIYKLDSGITFKGTKISVRLLNNTYGPAGIVKIEAYRNGALVGTYDANLPATPGVSTYFQGDITFAPFDELRFYAPVSGVRFTVQNFSMFGSSYVAHFGYFNRNDYPVTIPVGNDNKFTPSPVDRGQPRLFEPGRQRFVFAVPFDGSNLVWTLKSPNGESGTSTASATSTPCDPDFVPYPTAEPVVPIAQCVSDLGEGGVVARFGYENSNPFAVTIPLGTNNSFSPAPADRGQTYTFLPGLRENVFEVSLYGGPLTWSLTGPDYETYSATADIEELPGCADDQGFGLDDYLTEGLGVPDDLVDEYFDYLFDQVDSNADLTGLRGLMQEYLALSSTSETFRFVPVASSGNYAPWLGGTPLSPANWPEMIAVAASLGNEGPQWQFSQDGNVIAPGAGFPLNEDQSIAGTSFAAPFVSMIAAQWMTYPDACVFDGTNPPLLPAFFPKDSNQPFAFDTASPLNCAFNTPPVVENPGNQENTEGETISLQIQASDDDEDTLTFSAIGLPPGLAIDSDTGLISGILPFNSANTYFVTVQVSDGQATDSEEFVWVVNDAPIDVCYAQAVVAYYPGTRKDGGALPDNRDNPENALGAPQNNDTYNFVSLGFGDLSTTGVIILDMGPNLVLNQNGTTHDIRIWETSFNDKKSHDTRRAWRSYPEAVQVYVSQDGVTWSYLGQTNQLDQSYDLGTLEWARYVKLIDVTDRSNRRFNGAADGFDVDAVEGFACAILGSSEPEPPASGPRIIESNEAIVGLTGTWTSVDTDNASGGSYLYNTGAAEMTLEFEGTRIEINYIKGPSFGSFTVFVDGTAIRTVNTHRHHLKFDNKVVINYLDPGNHTLRIVPSGTVAIDAFYGDPQ